MTDSGKKEARSALPPSDSDNFYKKELIWKNFTRELLSASVVLEHIMLECYPLAFTFFHNVQSDPQMSKHLQYQCMV